MSAGNVEIPQSAETKQTIAWQGKFGRDYTDRNILDPAQLDQLWLRNYGVSRSDVNLEFLADIPKDAKILEIGCNIGNQLLMLQKHGFRNLTAIEIQSYAVDIARSRIPDAVLKQASALSLPFASDSFDLVFTSGVLIHIAPANLSRVLSEIYRCTRRYIWGTEYFSTEPESVNYRGHDELLWKMDYASQYLSLFPDLRLIRERRLRYLENGNVDTVFLLKKQEAGER